MMKARIVRGSDQIGGSCLELEAAGHRLVIDLGLPLDGAPHPTSLPAVDLDAPGLSAVVIPHSHPDHYGLLEFLPESVPIYMGEATASILREASFYTPLGLRRPVNKFLADRTPIGIGPFEVTPYLVDHSAFDAYALLVEADGGRLLYSGDLRLHGRKSKAMKALIATPPPDLDVLVLEGTALS
jgi:ribonuclease J